MRGKKLEHYQWKEKILGLLTMQVGLPHTTRLHCRPRSSLAPRGSRLRSVQTTDFYADISNPRAAVPYFKTSALTPLGQHLGTNNESWTNFRAGTPPASKFDIAGVDTCPIDNDCGQQLRQHHRLSSGQLYSFLSYMRK